MQVNIGLRVLTRPIPSRLQELYRTLGTNYDERVLPSIIQVCTGDGNTAEFQSVVDQIDEVSVHK